ncbi:MAG TPA: fumarylacetoacetate hydrolase family protein [Stellaceae bacterium]|jgi:2-keto-4-pentenoate hydratase/2-oxohepta-3-ene-1,7-dioic acid hydratase in catechol pathway|nr:fumarylacetoacetate hydrolase family protein [Stellaceae bacterium]
MRFVTFEPKPAIERFGVLLGDGGILDCEAGVAAALAREVPADRARALAHAMAPPNAQDFIANGRIALDAARRALQFAEEESRAGRALAGPRGETIAFALGEVKLLAPVPRPRKFIAAGKNYFEHQDEMGRPADSKVPALPIAHVQFASTVVGPDATVPMPPETKHLDYEVEIAVVIGRSAWRVPRESALDYVFGYTVYNDLSDRDLYRGEARLGGGVGLLGKNFAGFSPLGPYLCTPDEIGDPQVLGLRSRVNGQMRQNSTAQRMMYKIDEQIAHWSGIGLEPGDILGTGTPGGVAAGRKPDQEQWWLKPGDVVECEIDRIGTLRTRIG